ncbi:hypothetical protein DFH11DRAFT_1721660 [Phellopilus nigrolimitatus]|nr:hypothetical protein DFH11DRAFT_1721660 [Phellopilus nigrolimitatus]
MASSSAIVPDTGVNSERTFGALFVGFVLSTILYGLTFFQTYLYFSRYPKDALPLRTLGLLATATFVFGIAAASRLFHDRAIESFFHGSLKTYTSLNTGLSFLCDALVAGALSFYLAPSRNPAVKTPGSFIERAVVYILNRGTLSAYVSIQISLFDTDVNSTYPSPSSIVQLAFFLSFALGPAQQIWAPFPAAIGGVHINVLLVMLNYRDAQNGRGLREGELTIGEAPMSAGMRGANIIGPDSRMVFALGSQKTARTIGMRLSRGDERAGQGPVSVQVRRGREAQAHMETLELERLRSSSKEDGMKRVVEKAYPSDSQEFVLDVSKGHPM